MSYGTPESRGLPVFHVVGGWFKTSRWLSITGMLLYGNSEVLFPIPGPLTVLGVLSGKC